MSLNFFGRAVVAIREIRASTAMNLRWQRMNYAIARGGASSLARRIDPETPATWEFSGFSQNGEDGIIDFLLSQLKSSNRYFVEIGAADGLENNSSWLALVHRFSGLMVEGNPRLSQRCTENFESLNWGLRIVNSRVTRESAQSIIDLALHKNPDLLSLDIDGIDYHVVMEMLKLGLRPKIIVVEYNSAFGPETTITVPYKADFDFAKEHATRLYYGVSVAGWKKALASHGYRFVTVDQNGVNAFFADSNEFVPEFLNSVRGLDFRQNFAQFSEQGVPWSGQYELIKDCEFVQI